MYAILIKNLSTVDAVCSGHTTVHPTRWHCPFTCMFLTCDILTTTTFTQELFVFPQEKRAFRECRLLENLNKMTSDTNEHDLPRCTESMHEKLCDALTRRKSHHLQ